MNRKKISVLFLVFIMIAAVTLAASGCGDSGKGKEEATEKDNTTASKRSDKEIVLAVTESLRDSGFLGEIIPKFTDETGYEVELMPLTSKEVLDMGEKGEADVLLVHYPQEEKKFVKGGYADKKGRQTVMSGEYILVGPKDDPAGARIKGKQDIERSFKAIADKKAIFVTGKENRETYLREAYLWEKAGVTDKGSWYTRTDNDEKGVLSMAGEKKAYALVDNATWLASGKNADLKPISRGGTLLKDPYSVICTDAERHKEVNGKGAEALRKWLLSDRGKKAIKELGIAKYDKSIYTTK